MGTRLHHCKSRSTNPSEPYAENSVKKGGNFGLEPTASFGVAQDLGRATGEPLAVGHTTLNKRLNEKGLLASIDSTRGTLTVRRRVAGTLVPVLHLRSDALASGKLPQEEPTVPVEVFSV